MERGEGVPIPGKPFTIQGNAAVFEREMSRLEKILEINPLLGMELSFLDVKETFHFPKITLKLSSSTEVLIVKGVMRCFDSLSPLLNRGGLVVFLEPNLEKIRSFIELEEVVIGENVRIISDKEPEIHQIAWLSIFKTVQFIGDLPHMKEAIDQAHLFISDYREFGKTLLVNVQKNLLRMREYVDGRDLKGILKGKPIIICGSGGSLDENIEYIKRCSKDAVILATGSSIPKLADAGIKIDFAAFVEPNPPVSSYGEYNFPIFYQNRMSAELLLKFHGKKIWMGESGGWPIIKWFEDEAGLDSFTFESGWNVGNFGLAIAEHLGCDRIYLIGLDSCIQSNRPLRSEEYVVEGMLTRRDLHRGITWMKEFILSHPHIDVVQGFPYLSIDGARKNIRWFEELNQEISKVWDLPLRKTKGESIVSAVASFHNKEVQKGVEAFLEKLKGGVDKTTFGVAKIQLDACLLAEPIYEYLLEPLWKLFEKVYLPHVLGEYPPDVKESIARAQFFIEVLKTNLQASVKSFRGLSQSLLFDGQLEGKVRRYYPSGEIFSEEYYVNGEPDGIWISYYRNGNLKSSVSFKRGDLHGKFNLFHEEGRKREGVYDRGKKVGSHRIWSEKNRIVFEGEFDQGLGVGLHRRYSYDGNIAEEIEHLDEKRFNKKSYDSEGRLSYEGRFEEDLFIEKSFHKEELIRKRSGQFVDGRVLWD